MLKDQPREFTYELVMPEDADPERGFVSVASPVGRSLVGSDTLTGGLGADDFTFSALFGGSPDRITDFSVAEGDRIVFDQTFGKKFRVKSVSGGQEALAVDGAGGHPANALTIPVDHRVAVVRHADALLRRPAMDLHAHSTVAPASFTTCLNQGW